jgi:hypothetical protein
MSRLRARRPQVCPRSVVPMLPSMRPPGGEVTDRRRRRTSFPAPTPGDGCGKLTFVSKDHARRGNRRASFRVRAYWCKHLFGGTLRFCGPPWETGGIPWGCRSVPLPAEGSPVPLGKPRFSRGFRDPKCPPPEPRFRGPIGNAAVFGCTKVSPCFRPDPAILGPDPPVPSRPSRSRFVPQSPRGSRLVPPPCQPPLRRARSEIPYSADRTASPSLGPRRPRAWAPLESSRPFGGGDRRARPHDVMGP